MSRPRARSSRYNVSQFQMGRDGKKTEPRRFCAACVPLHRTVSMTATQPEKSTIRSFNALRTSTAYSSPRSHRSRNTFLASCQFGRLKITRARLPTGLGDLSVGHMNFIPKSAQSGDARTNSFSKMFEFASPLSDVIPNTSPSVDIQTNRHESAQNVLCRALRRASSPIHRIRIGAVSAASPRSPNIREECPSCLSRRTGICFDTSSNRRSQCGAWFYTGVHERTFGHALNVTTADEKQHKRRRPSE